MGKLEVDQDLIRELAALLDETGLTEIEVSDDDNRLRVARMAGTVMAAAPAIAAASGTAAAPAEVVGVEAEFDADHPGAITSPMVGTAYLAPEPTAADFVSVGEQVIEGQTLLIIEAMKTFNEIPSPKSGMVKAIMFDNQSPVEFGDVLMIIE